MAAATASSRSVRSDGAPLSGPQQQHQQDQSTSAESTTAGLLGLQSAPGSIARVQRGIHVALETTQQDASLFRSNELRRARCGPRMQPLLQTVQKVSGVSPITQPEAMMEILDAVSGQPQLDQADVAEMSRVCRRLFIFKRMLEAVTERFKVVLDNNLYKYCLSFVEEAEGQSLPPVSKYEEFIRDTKAGIEAHRQRMRQLETEGGFRELDLAGYIAAHDKASGMMGSWCEEVIEATKAAQQWLVYDHNYPKKLQEYITQLTKRRVSHREQLQELENRASWDHSRVLKAEQAKSQAERYVKEVRGERASFAAREKSVANNKQRVEDLMHELLATRDRHLVRLSESNPTETVRKFHLASVADCESRKVQLEKRLAACSAQTAELQREQERCDKNLRAARQLLEERDRALQALLDEMTQVKSVEKALRSELGVVADQVRVLQKIREIKLHSDTVRKIFRFGYQPGQYQEVRDSLDEVFKDLAAVIGGRWRQVYHRLPFKPARDFPTRSRDLELIDISHRRLDATLDLLAYKALQKWRRISLETATPEALLNVLRQLRLVGVQTSR